jgi:ankyrin repeat protein
MSFWQKIFRTVSNLGDSSDHTIHDAARRGDFEKARVLLMGNSDLVFARDNFSWTPLHAAAFRGYEDIAEMLLANGADVNAKDQIDGTPLHYAADKGHKKVVELLLINNADVKVKNTDGETPLQVAESSGHNNVAELLRHARTEYYPVRHTPRRGRDGRHE